MTDYQVVMFINFYQIALYLRIVYEFILSQKLQKATVILNEVNEG